MNFDNFYSIQEKNIAKTEPLRELWTHKKEPQRAYNPKNIITSPSVDIDTNITKEILEAFTGRFNLYKIADASEKILNYTNKKKLLDDIFTKGTHDKNIVFTNLVDGMMGVRLDNKVNYKLAVKEVISYLDNLLKKDNSLIPTPKEFARLERVRKWSVSNNIAIMKKKPKEIEQDVIKFIKNFTPEHTDSLLKKISREGFDLIINAIKTGKVGDIDVNVSTIVIATTNSVQMLKSGYVYEEDLGIKGERKRDLYDANHELLESQGCFIRSLLTEKRSQEEKINYFFQRAKKEPIKYAKDALLNISKEDFNLALAHIRKGGLGANSTFQLMKSLLENKSTLEEIGKLGTRKRDVYDACSDYVKTLKKEAL